MSAFVSSHLGPTAMFILTTVLQTVGCASMALIIGRGRAIGEQLMSGERATVSPLAANLCLCSACH